MMALGHWGAQTFLFAKCKAMIEMHQTFYFNLKKEIPKTSKQALGI